MCSVNVNQVLKCLGLAITGTDFKKCMLDESPLDKRKQLAHPLLRRYIAPGWLLETWVDWSE